MVEQQAKAPAGKYFPPIAAANPIRVFKLGLSEAILYDAIPKSGRAISYKFVLAVFTDDSKEPAFCIASEYSASIPKGEALLGFFDGTEHRPIDVSSDWLDLARFGVQSTTMAAKILQVSADQISEVHFETPAITIAVRTPRQIQAEFGISPEEFHVLYVSYETMFAVFPGCRDWNVDLNREERTREVLRPEEIAVANRRLSQAINNRVILGLDHARRNGDKLFPSKPKPDGQAKPTSPWWKLW